MKPQTWNEVKPGAPLTFPQIPTEICFAADKHTVAMLVPFDTDYYAPQRLILFDLATRKVRLLGVPEKRIATLQWSKDGKFLTFFIATHATAKHDSIAVVPVEAGEGVPFEQFDWKQTTPLKCTELFALPEGAQQVNWKE